MSLCTSDGVSRIDESSRRADAAEVRHRLAERAQIVAQHVEVARFVVRLRGRRHLGFDVVDALGEIGRDRPRRQLAPQEDRQHLERRLLLVGGQLRRAVLGDQRVEHLAAVPDVVLPDVVQALELVEARLRAGR